MNTRVEYMEKRNNKAPPSICLISVGCHWVLHIAFTFVVNEKFIQLSNNINNYIKHLFKCGIVKFTMVFVACHTYITKCHITLFYGYQ
jgi:hypothetical protein